MSKPVNKQQELTLTAVSIEPGRSMGKALCEPGWSWRIESLPDYDLWYALSGSGSMRINGEWFPISAGVCFLLRPGDRIEAEQHADDRLRVIFIHFQAHAGAGLSWHPPARRAEIADTIRFEQLLNRLLELRDTSPDWSELEFSWTLKLLLLELHRLERLTDGKERASYKHKQTVHRLIDMLRQSIGSDPDFERLAEAAGLSKRYISLLFKQHTGLPLKQYVTKLRMERARALLAETTMTASQIAEAVGYADVFVFSKIFKAYHGISPTAYREQAPYGHPHGRP